MPVADDQNSLRVGARGPTLLEDYHFREKLFHFDHERIPERVVHARGFGAHGYFENDESLADKCPVAHFQQDGHMAMHNPRGRVNYEPNSWGKDGGPRKSPQAGFQSYPAHEEGSKSRVRSETFADHYSQARQFLISQTDIEQTHIANALMFELSKVETPAIRARVVSHLRNIDEALAKRVADGLRLKEMPAPATAARPTRQDLKPSAALSIVNNGPRSFAGRKVGALVTDGVDASILAGLAKSLKAEGAMLKLVAPEVGGVKDSAGAWHDADEKLEGGPSVLFDAVAILPSKDGATLLGTLPAARDFVADAAAHRKILAHVADAAPLLAKAGVAGNLDAGYILLGSAGDCDRFVTACRALRFWDRAEAERSFAAANEGVSSRFLCSA